MAHYELPPPSRIRQDLRTYEICIDVQRILHRGSKQDCEEWMRRFTGAEIFAKAADGTVFLIGVTRGITIRLLP